MSLVEKIRAAREQRVEVGGYAFTVRRPTFAEVLAMGERGFTVDDAARFVVGWSGVRELDLYPGGAGHAVPFEAEACAEWLADRPDLLGPIAEAAARAYREHRDRLESAAGN